MVDHKLNRNGQHDIAMKKASVILVKYWMQAMGGDGTSVFGTC